MPNEESTDPSTAAQFVLGPIGGAVIGALLYPLGCKTEQLFCPTGEQTNFLGVTMGGFVGTVDKLGAFIIGVVAAGICYLLASQITSK